MRIVALFYICTNLFNVWLNRRQLHSHVCFCIQSVAICCVGWSIWRKPASNRYVVGIKRSTLTAFSGSCGYSFLILHQNLTSGSFLKVSCSVEPETISMKFRTVTFKSILALGINLLPMHDFVTSLQALVIWKILVHWDMQILQMLKHPIIQYQKVTFVNITTDLIRKVLKYWEAVKLTMADTIFPKF